MVVRNRIVVVAPRQQMVVHSGLDIYDNGSVKKAEAFIKSKEAEYGEIELLLLAGGTMRIMEPNEPIPVPLRSSKL